MATNTENPDLGHIETQWFKPLTEVSDIILEAPLLIQFSLSTWKKQQGMATSGWAPEPTGKNK